MRVLAIDPGYGRCGVAVLEKQNGKEVLLYSECIETSAKSSFTERLGAVVAGCQSVLDRFSPDCVALEKLYFSTNQKTAMQVAEVRGALIGMASAAGLPVSEYTPAQVKNAAAGWGGADKKQVVKMLHALVQIDKKIKLDDEYDAIAVGVTHLAHAR